MSSEGLDFLKYLCERNGIDYQEIQHAVKLTAIEQLRATHEVDKERLLWHIAKLKEINAQYQKRLDSRLESIRSSIESLGYVHKVDLEDLARRIKKHRGKVRWRIRAIEMEINAVTRELRALLE